jgi:hypothetical protein
LAAIADDREDEGKDTEPLINELFQDRHGGFSIFNKDDFNQHVQYEEELSKKMLA